MPRSTVPKPKPLQLSMAQLDWLDAAAERLGVSPDLAFDAALELLWSDLDRRPRRRPDPDQRRAYYRQRRLAAIAAGKCICCSTPARTGMVMCLRCARLDAERGRKYYRQQKDRDKDK